MAASLSPGGRSEYAADQRRALAGGGFLQLAGMEAISTTNSENEAEPEENFHHTPFASPLETPWHHYF